MIDFSDAAPPLLACAETNDAACVNGALGKLKSVAATVGDNQDMAEFEAMPLLMFSEETQCGRSHYCRPGPRGQLLPNDGSPKRWSTTKIEHMRYWASPRRFLKTGVVKLAYNEIQIH